MQLNPNHKSHDKLDRSPTQFELAVASLKAAKTNSKCFNIVKVSRWSKHSGSCMTKYLKINFNTLVLCIMHIYYFDFCFLSVFKGSLYGNKLCAQHYP